MDVENKAHKLTEFFGRVYSNALALVAMSALFGSWMISNDAFRPYAMTVGGGLVAAYIAVAVVFAGQTRKSHDGWSPLDLNVLMTFLALGVVLVQMLMAVMRVGDFTTSALDALLGAAVGGTGVVIMAFAKSDSS